MRAALSKIATFIMLIKREDMIIGLANAEMAVIPDSKLSTKTESFPAMNDCFLASRCLFLIKPPSDTACMGEWAGAE